MTAPAPAARSQEARNVVETGSVKSRAGKENPLLESTCASVKIQITQSRLTTMQVSGPRSRNNRLIAAVIRYKGDACSIPWPKVVAICSRAQGNRADEDFIQFVETATESRSGVALAAVEADKRQVLEKLFGQYGAEALVLASDPDH